MKTNTATAMALALVAGVAAIGAAPAGAVDESNCTGNPLDFRDVGEGTVAGSDLDKWEIEVPLIDPVTEQEMTEVRLKIDVVTVGSDVGWDVYRVESACSFVTGDDTAILPVDAVLDPNDTYYVHVFLTLGSTADYEILMEPHSFA